MRKNNLSSIDIEQIILMSWGDTISFDTISREYALTHDQIVAVMRKHQSPKTYARWRERSTKIRTGTSSKHEVLTYMSSRRQKFSI